MMPVLATLTLVWLGAQRPEGRAKAALDAWAEARGAKLEEPRAEAPEGADKASALSSECDHALDHARDLLNSGDSDGARQTLRQLEQTLRDHPELLQAAWLMAERYRLEAQVAARDSPGASSSSDEAYWDRKADALEGVRAVAFGSRPRSIAPLDNVSTTLAVHGARRYELFWDGSSASDRVATPPGEHHLLIRRGGRVAWSSWISVLASGTVDVWVPDADPCSAEDLTGVSLGPEPVVPAGVRCPAWVVAAPGARGTVAIALCSGDRCQPVVTSAYETFVGTPGGETSKKGALPGWAAWTIAGAGVVAATTVILWKSGAFDAGKAEQHVVWSGF